ncbi:MAG: Crossover junction endodeoxyribonuclease RuvC [Candidatus Jorgensenbacteria bacterium GW2011_GWA1_48_13]|uniref:Crossover junction endodeoxyribonuclease RuvC n=2 Tax=Candidatus Joergenseniibacteriota TaxID=1752739 RepID=A0A0G1YJX4_9BACT|nr:MAG: Crossover junction endodeoxyribonuclease RuvC [Candidatus Jorgensenbacteria bacterium GW2011_GWA1_48_13]KKU99058.1 MAG: Crossover junction endodeoxyribonuclease RuvC [Candidatus Jorgensenbacteria bacterium GW2011_GWC1_48_8]KKW15302.1 MAG: Crossover junction endodeoxyribonuclease RuvC [Candidatus Jorgensenbacteria bacterium GW2011_GWB1_50_10]
MIILGIDPGTVRVGYGVIEKNGGKLTHLESGLIKLPAENYEVRLVALEKNLKELLRKFRPDRVGLERLFFEKNRKTAIRVAEARGVILKTIVQNSIPLKELNPKEVKLAVTGDGNASKDGVGKMVKYFLKLGSLKMLDDVSDALAIAIAAASLERF